MSNAQGDEENGQLGQQRCFLGRPQRGPDQEDCEGPGQLSHHEAPLLPQVPPSPALILLRARERCTPHSDTMRLRRHRFHTDLLGWAFIISAGVLARKGVVACEGSTLL